MHPSQMTGLQLLQAMSHGELPRASISETIPMTMDVIEAGTVHFTARATSATSIRWAACTAVLRRRCSIP